MYKLTYLWKFVMWIRGGPNELQLKVKFNADRNATTAHTHKKRPFAAAAGCKELIEVYIENNKSYERVRNFFPTSPHIFMDLISVSTTCQMLRGVSERKREREIGKRQ